MSDRNESEDSESDSTPGTGGASNPGADGAPGPNAGEFGTFKAREAVEKTEQAEQTEKKTPATSGESPGPPILQWASILGVAATFIASLVTAWLTHQTQGIVDQSSHAQEFAKAFASNSATITGFMHSNRRTDEQEADLALTALNDFAQSPDDKMAILTIAARMLNATDCPGSGEATARFLTIVVEHLKAERTATNDRLLQFLRSPGFLSLASDDVTTVYFNDDDADDANYPIRCGSTTTTAQRQLNSPRQPPRPLLFTPAIGDQRNHATYWGERAIWNDARVQLFRELRADRFAGWVHVATWETQDACVDAAGRLRRTLNPRTKRATTVSCTPIRVSYASTPFRYAVGDKGNVRTPFWLGRARFLRDAPPHMYEHSGETPPMNLRGKLGHVIGTVEAGECVQPISEPVYAGVSPRDEPRHFVHAWVEVGPADRSACWPAESVPTN